MTIQFNYLHFASQKPSNNPVLYLPGFKAASNGCSALAKMISANHDFYGLNFPGINNTPIIHTPLQIQELIDYTIAFIEEKQLDNITIIAHSMGGLIANFVSQQLKTKIKNIILVSPLNPFVFQFFSEWEQYFFANKIEDQFQLIKMLYANGEKLLANTNFQSGLIKRLELEKSNPLNPQLLSLFHSMNNAEIQSKLLDLYHNNTIHTLVLLGGYDGLFNRVDQLSLFQKNYKNAIVKLIPNTGHVMTIEHPEQFFNQFVEFN